MMLASRIDDHSPAGAGRAPRAPGTLRDLLAALEGEGVLARGDDGTRVRSVSTDSRRVGGDTLFVAVQGRHADGLAFVRDACARGAVAIAVPAGADLALLGVDVPIVRCTSPQRFVALAASELAGRPSDAMKVVGITGTSGKTTTSYILEAIFRAAGRGPGVIGTIEYRFPGHHEEAPLTTPDAVALQGLLARMRDGGVDHVAMEVSSHALAQDRVTGVAYDVGIFTNISRDHLDYHGDMDDYLAAKARLFRELLPASRKASGAVLNAEDPRVMAIAPDLRVPVSTFGRGGDVSCDDLETDMHGMRGTLDLHGERVRFRSRLVGAPHLMNILAAAAAAHRLGIATRDVCTGIESLTGVPGRLEPIAQGQPFAVVVDYAHKPDALERSLQSLRELTRGRLIVVFGCGGDRDKGKRPLMGEIAGRLAEIVIITSDNPRTEEPMAILEAIESGVRGASRAPVASQALGQTGGAEGYVVVPERRAAIALAIGAARPGDLVLITGKGHEDYQIVGTTKHHLDDREEARSALRSLGYDGSQG
ncbi:MAG: UDP-N-acetylmuramoyl-L-alanyl-D-glutamate--2,6-diaminopimelate ligase [Deltaproteobacteria bacterium]|nr:UDP-N-acetylmuramoyl-L-alanyl-D-glutamate--2,6-diaminopimelate ligase [Deltaproteobacteria bacterium]